MSLLQAEENLQATVNTAEAHEGHGEETCGDEGDGDTPEGLGHIDKIELLTESGEEHHGEEEANTCGERIDDAFEQVVVLLDDKDGDTEDAAVGGDEGEEHAKCLIEGGHGLLEDNLNHLHQGCDDEDERDGLEVLKAKGVEHIHLQEVGHDGGNHENGGHKKSVCPKGNTP